MKSKTHSIKTRIKELKKLRYKAQKNLHWRTYYLLDKSIETLSKWIPELSLHLKDRDNSLPVLKMNNSNLHGFSSFKNNGLSTNEDQVLIGLKSIEAIKDDLKEKLSREIGERYNAAPTFFRRKYMNHRAVNSLIKDTLMNQIMEVIEDTMELYDIPPRSGESLCQVCEPNQPEQ